MWRFPNGFDAISSRGMPVTCFCPFIYSFLPVLSIEILLWCRCFNMALEKPLYNKIVGNLVRPWLDLFFKKIMEYF